MSTTVGPEPSLQPEGRFDSGAEVHPDELYRPQTGVSAVSVAHLEDIGAPEVAVFREQGYLVVREAFQPEEVADALAGLLHLIMGGNPNFAGVWFEAKARDILPTLSADQRQDAIRKLVDFAAADSRLGAMAHHAKLLRVVRLIIGSDEPFMFQDMALLKPPRLGREKPWHQDHAYFDYPLGTPVLGVWIALDEATVENGCMQVLPGRHKEGPIAHFQKRDWQICDTAVLGTRSMAVPLKPGGLLLFDGLLPHGTPPNSSPNRRRALQFHYAPKGLTKTSKEERLRHFGGEGRNVTC